jgi:Mor family transcriptional regulator
MNENEEAIITLVFENAANENKKWEIAAVSGELMRDYAGRAAKQMFVPVPQRVGLATKDGAIVQDWSDKTVAQVTEKFRTNHFVIGTPDQLGLSSLFKRYALSDDILFLQQAIDFRILIPF